MKKSTRDVTPRRGYDSSYPEPFRRLVIGRTRWSLGDVFELDQFGVALVELAPGAASSIRHWHSHEDEFVYVLEGEPTLVTDEGEELLQRGDFVGFKRGVPISHHLVNRSHQSAIYLEIGSRHPNLDVAHYPHDDLEARSNGARRAYFRKNGQPY
jgi:uncharacterized cupin superfamily protein